ncbi:MAG: serine hydrolase [Kiritimatiellae bacterium]|nr:serine hydrolase [Kiritimatiellia bacterium]MDD5522798.1 serine hydrolase [Kiritimatiellia bacterium]
MTLNKNILIACSVMALVWGVEAQDDTPDSCDSVASFNDACISNGFWTGAAVLAGTPARVLFRQSWGWMDRAKTVPMPVDGIFDLASVTKVVGTATALAICMDRHLIDPDMVFTNYLPGYRGELKGPVTVRDLARHISGFDNSKFYDIEGQVTNLILSFSPSRQAGEQYLYSCANFILLGLIVERVSGKDLGEFCRENIFEPLGMRDTRWAPLPGLDARRVVMQPVTQTLGMASDPPARHANHPIGNAGLFSTVDDLGIFCRMMLAGGKLGKNQFFSGQVVKVLEVRPDTRSPAAFGWRVDPQYNPPSLSAATMSHTGWAGNSIWIDPVKQYYVVVLTNRTGENAKVAKARIELAEHVLQMMKNLN